MGEETTNGITSEYTKDNTYGDLLTTGASSQTEKYHIFDMAGNLWEWTEEDSHYATSGQYRISRGSSFGDASGSYPVCYRTYYTINRTAHSLRISCDTLYKVNILKQ